MKHFGNYMKILVPLVDNCPHILPFFHCFWDFYKLFLRVSYSSYSVLQKFPLWIFPDNCTFGWLQHHAMGEAWVLELDEQSLSSDFTFTHYLSDSLHSLQPSVSSSSFPPALSFLYGKWIHHLRRVNPSTKANGKTVLQTAKDLTNVHCNLIITCKVNRFISILSNKV